MSNQRLSTLETSLNKLDGWLGTIITLFIAIGLSFGLAYLLLVTVGKTALSNAELLELVKHTSQPECVTERLLSDKHGAVALGRHIITRDDIRDADATCKHRSSIQILLQTLLAGKRWALWLSQHPS